MKKTLPLLCWLCLLPSAWGATMKVSEMTNAGRLASNALFSVSVFNGGTTQTMQVAFGQLMTQLSDEANIVDYGATAYIPPNMTSGSYITNPPADSSVAIQAAFNAAFASGGKTNTVYVPKGIFAIGTNIFVPPGINVRGVGSLHAGDYADAVTRLNTNSFSIIWQTNLNRAGLVFNNLEKKGSWARMIEVCGHTNPIAYGDTGTGNLATSPSSTMANGPGVFLGRSSITDWDTTAVAGGVGYAGDFQSFGLVVTGWKTGIRCTANSVNFIRTHMVACDTGWQNSDVCCGGDQTHFDSCSASMRPNGVGYRFHSGGGNRGCTFTTPGDYELGQWIVGTNFTMTARGGNLEFTHAASVATNFIESWGNNHIVLEGMRIQFPAYGNPGATLCLINNSYTADNEYGPLGEVIGCQIDIPPYTNATAIALKGNITNASGDMPLLLRVGPYNRNNFKAGGGTRGWVEVLNGSHAPVYAYPLNADAAFAPAINQPIIFGSSAWSRGDNLMDLYGVASVIKATGGLPDVIEVWLMSAAGILTHQRLLLGDASTSTSAISPNTVTLDGITVNTGLSSFNANLTIANGSSSSGVLKLMEDSDNGSNFASFQAPASLTANTVYTLPSDDGNSGDVLQSNGSGVLSWTPQTGGSGFGEVATNGLLYTTNIYSRTATTNLSLVQGTPGGVKNLYIDMQYVDSNHSIMGMGGETLFSSLYLNFNGITNAGYARFLNWVIMDSDLTVNGNMFFGGTTYFTNVTFTTPFDAGIGTNYAQTNIVSYAATFPSATNTFYLNNGYATLSVATDVSITNLSGIVAGQARWGTLMVSNSAASAITVRNTVGATVRLQGAATTNALSIGAAKIGYLTFQAMGATNLWDTSQQ